MCQFILGLVFLFVITSLDTNPDCIEQNNISNQSSPYNVKRFNFFKIPCWFQEPILIQVENWRGIILWMLNIYFFFLSLLVKNSNRKIYIYAVILQQLGFFLLFKNQHPLEKNTCLKLKLLQQPDTFFLFKNLHPLNNNFV